ncbi:hypothetical protein M116_3734 [Bacteroides fragilis str. 3719 A10]|uniref:Transposase n=2 Tax=Bacteroides fragilis TaxID=817 RepID=A0AB73AFQ1_BACFG|nr:hypothetical protein M118_3334 [Bacteroides fragilis str. 3783N1-2]EXY49922.1 hypothetical protein M121_3313 [Bacteroides fragilis str. 3783N2-1]EXY54705.1 hypothetical protein M122_3291 [Bacteroides fragilis str. 3976T7]EXY83058.1 hypothetical protein M079_3768 [Bacteroides fragilis str. 3996 N(B) 6]EXY94159.1 hypothetical protein M081_3752 [Bacteroides fragilis str. 3998 T(B) 4]EXZ56639.1 hypothetical protein M116_3734 [Bacteroides fragilis str. 3719 A10]EYA37681.1 hypothetical protein M
MISEVTPILFQRSIKLLIYTKSALDKKKARTEMLYLCFLVN